MKTQTETKDFYGEIGCCLTCDETKKEQVRGLERDLFFAGKHYDCLCLDGKCLECAWYYRGECQRKFMEDSLLEH